MAQPGPRIEVTATGLPVELLFVPVPSGAPLFESITDLGHEIFGQGDSHHKDVASLLASLSAVLNLKRPAGLELRSQILAAFRRRIREHEGWEAEDVLERFEALLSADPGVAKIRCDRTDIAALLRQTRQCTSLAAVVPPGALSDSCSRHVLQAIVERLQAVPGSGCSSDSCFWFLCPSRLEAVDFWRAVILQWTAASETIMNPRTAIDELTKLEKRGTLKVFEVSPEFCLFTALFINPAQEATASAFLFDVFAPGVISLCRMSPELIQRWLRSVYLRLQLGDIGKFIPLSEATSIT